MRAVDLAVQHTHFCRKMCNVVNTRFLMNFCGRYLVISVVVDKYLNPSGRPVFYSWKIFILSTMVLSNFLVYVISQFMYQYLSVSTGQGLLLSP